MRLIRKKEIRFVKLLLVSPWLEQVINAVYLFTLPIIAFKFIYFDSNFSNYEINTKVYENFNKDLFYNISNKESFINYLDIIANTLYEYKHDNPPFFIPMGSIRMKKFSIVQKPECEIKRNCSESIK